MVHSWTTLLCRCAASLRLLNPKKRGGGGGGALWSHPLDDLALVQFRTGPKPDAMELSTQPRAGPRGQARHKKLFEKGGGGGGGGGVQIFLQVRTHRTPPPPLWTGLPTAAHTIVLCMHQQRPVRNCTSAALTIFAMISKKNTKQTVNV